MTHTRFARTIEQSGADLAAAAVGPVDGQSGSYINGRIVEPSSAASYDRDRETALWNELARLGTPGNRRRGVCGGASGRRSHLDDDAPDDLAAFERCERLRQVDEPDDTVDHGAHDAGLHELHEPGLHLLALLAGREVEA